jgi:hypothetical protein
MKLIIDYAVQGGGVISSYEAINPTWRYALNEAGTCSWGLAFSQTDLSNRPIAPDEFGPKRNDFILRTDTGTYLQGGRLLSVTMDSESELIQCAGKDWLEYLDQPFPFDYTQTINTLADNLDEVFRAYIVASGTDTVNVKYNVTQQKIIQNILDAANNLSDIFYTPVFTGTGWTQVSHYEIPSLDETTMLGHIQAISAYADPMGFDFWCDWNQTINMHSPRIITPNSVTTILNLVWGVDPVVKVNWTNNGPKATRTVGKNSSNMWKERHFVNSIAQFRDYLEIVDFGERYNFALSDTALQHQIDVATDAVGTLDWNPQKELSITVIPERLFPGNPEAGFRPMVGSALSFNSGALFHPYHTVNASFYIVSQDYKTEDNGANYTMDFGLQQIYG